MGVEINKTVFQEGVGAEDLLLYKHPSEKWGCHRGIRQALMRPSGLENQPMRTDMGRSSLDESALYKPCGCASDNL